MLLTIISIICNIVYCIVLNVKLYTDRAILPGGALHALRRSPADRLYAFDRPAWLYAQLALGAVSVISGALLLLGLNRRTIKCVQIIATAASTVVFIIIMMITGSAHAKYA